MNSSEWRTGQYFETIKFQPLSHLMNLLLRSDLSGIILELGTAKLLDLVAYALPDGFSESATYRYCVSDCVCLVCRNEMVLMVYKVNCNTMHVPPEFPADSNCCLIIYNGSVAPVNIYDDRNTHLINFVFISTPADFIKLESGRGINTHLNCLFQFIQ